MGPEFKRGSTKRNELHDVIPGWTNVYFSGTMVTATAEDTCAALIYAADEMACYTGVVLTLKETDGSEKVVGLDDLRAAGVRTYPPPVRNTYKRDVDTLFEEKQAVQTELETVKAELEALKKKAKM